ncbi:MAG: alpha/beta hydrolase [Myxococcota bacterium]
MRTYVPDSEVVFREANGLRLACLESGPADGPLVLMFHGFPDTARTWDLVRPALAARGFRVVCLYQRGYAPSEIPADGRYDARVLGEDALALMDACGAEQAVLIGHDWGTQNVYSAGAMAPERVRHAVTVAIPYPTTIRPTLGKVWGVRHFLTLRMPGAARRFARDDFAAVDDLYRRWSPGFEWPESEYASVKNSFSSPGSLHAALGFYRALTVRPPEFLFGRQQYGATVIGGLTDGVATAEDFERSKKAWEPGRCAVHLLPGGHFLHREHPEAFEALLVEVLAPFA